jgi:phospholipase C
MFLEQFVDGKFGKKVREENISAWRRAVAGDLTSVFRSYDPNEPALDPLVRDKFLVGIEEAKYKEIPSAYKKLNAKQIEEINHDAAHSGLMPHQEEGIRPACALPYELYADGNVGEDGSHYELRLHAGNQVHGAMSTGVPFNVYLRNVKGAGLAAGGMMAATHAVNPGDTLTRQIPLSLFAGGGASIEVVGPNGFYRWFTCQSDASPLLVRATYERQETQLTGNMLVHLRNRSAKPLRISIRDNSYKSDTLTRSIAPGEEASVLLHLGLSHGWYDFTVVGDYANDEARYAGHVDTGKTSFSDPLMGQVI